MNPKFLIQNKWPLLFLLFFMLIFFVAFAFYIRSDPEYRAQMINAPSSYPLPPGGTRERGKVSTIQKTIIGKTTDQELQRIPQVTTKPLPNGGVEYSFPSDFAYRGNQVEIDKGVATFERIVTPESSSSEGYSTISEYKTEFGNPDKVIRGSRYYLYFAETYIYAKQGFALIGNPNTDEVYEIHVFGPMTVDSYIQKFGEDIDPDAKPHQDG